MVCEFQELMRTREASIRGNFGNSRTHILFPEGRDWELALGIFHFCRIFPA
jgi:hypothetical protein